MAQSIITETQLRLTFDLGVDGEGKMVKRSKNFNNVKTSATTDEIYAVAKAIGGLVQDPLFGIERNDSHLLGE